MARQAPIRIERGLWRDGYDHVAGVDEAGRGCLAGPVVAAAVILPQKCRLPGVDDSKTLTHEQREEVVDMILDKAISVGVGYCSPREIDKLNILWASMEAMRRAVCELVPGPDFLLIDGNHSFPNSEWPLRTVVKGDSASRSIAAASIIAKLARDSIMEDLDHIYPDYGMAQHKGYPTELHYDALRENGATPSHRRTFRLFDPPQFELFDAEPDVVTT